MKNSTEYKQSADDHGLSTILLAAPTTTEKKLGTLLRETTGFLYLVSLTGVTGARKSVAQVNLNFIKQVCRKAKGSARVAVGFGISKPDHVKTILQTGADGVIVGSAFVNIVANNLNDIGSAESELSASREACEARPKCVSLNSFWEQEFVVIHILPF